jgi:hypothetical protein
MGITSAGAARVPGANGSLRHRVAPCASGGSAVRRPDRTSTTAHRGWRDPVLRRISGGWVLCDEGIHPRLAGGRAG